jgi:transposase
VTELEAKDRRIAELEAEVAELKGQVRDLLAQLGRNSLNSSLPPSRDNAEAREKRKRKAKSRRPRGGQKGHKRSMRELVPPEQVDAIVALKATHCGGCGLALCGHDPTPVRRQVIEIPELRPHVTEYQQHTLGCPCGHETRPALPDELAHGDFGPRLAALVAVLTGEYRVSKRKVRELLADVFGVEMALGSVSKLEARVSEALAPVHQEVRRHVRNAPYVNMDETTWVEEREGVWLWVASTPDAAYYQIASDRSSEVVTAILGPDFKGSVGNDRAKCYLIIDPERRQVCWFHLGRNFQAKIELGGAAARFGEQMRAFERRMWKARHGYAEGELTSESYQRRMKMLQGEVHRALVGWLDHKIDGIGGMCQNLLNLEPAMWTFVSNPIVEPTNNQAERDIRHPVVWRRASFGTDSPRGSRFVERILTVVQTCKRQGLRAFQFLTNVLTAVRARTALPQLLPNTS